MQHDTAREEGGTRRLWLFSHLSTRRSPFERQQLLSQPFCLVHVMWESCGGGEERELECACSLFAAPRLRRPGPCFFFFFQTCTQRASKLETGAIVRCRFCRRGLWYTCNSAIAARMLTSSGSHPHIHTDTHVVNRLRHLETPATNCKRRYICKEV